MAPYGFLHVVQAIHGDCLMLEYDIAQTSKSGFMLIDGGPAQAYKRTVNNLGASPVNRYGTTDNLYTLLNDLSTDNFRPILRRLEAINTVVVTHDDQDHKNGIADLFKYLLGDITGNWQTGLDLIAKSKVPIENIWYNSQANLMGQFISTLPTKDQKKKPAEWKWNDAGGKLMKDGWFDALLERYNDKFPGRKKMFFNQEIDSHKFKTIPDVHFIAENSRGAYNNPVRKGQFTFKIIGPSYTGDLMQKKLIDELIKASEAEKTRVPNSGAIRNNGGGATVMAATTSSSKDSSARNKSSIAFVATDSSLITPANPGASIKLLMLGDAVIASQIKPGDYTIMKIAHHGSCHNNYLSQRENRASDSKIRIAGGTLRNAFVFFTEVRAKKYVISASPTEGSSNPHVTTMLGIYLAAVELRLQGKTNSPVDVYLTNDLPDNAIQGIGFILFNPDDVQYTGSTGNIEYAFYPSDDKTNGNTKEVLAALDFNHFDDNMRIWKLNAGIAYGSIPIYDPDPQATEWTRFSRDDFLQAAKNTNRPRKRIDKPAKKSTGGAPPPKRSRPI